MLFFHATTKRAVNLPLNIIVSFSLTSIEKTATFSTYGPNIILIIRNIVFRTDNCPFEAIIAPTIIGDILLTYPLLIPISSKKIANVLTFPRSITFIKGLNRQDIQAFWCSC